MQVGDVLEGRYRIVRRIGSGGMGTVWEAVDTVLAQPVALKHVTFAGLPADVAVESRKRTLREARNAARLRGEPDIIAIYDVLEAADGVWLVLEYLPSESLADVLDRVGRLPLGEVARIGAAVASGLAAAHARGVVHRDVKPGNVLIAHADGRVKLTDFGISQADGDPRLTASYAVSGTPAYMAREVAAGDDATPASDVFSLASTLYRAAEGVPPFGPGDNARRLIHLVATGMLRPPEATGPMTPLLMRMFDGDPERRPAAAAVAAELRAPDPSDTPTVRPLYPPRTPPTAPRRPRRRTVLVAGGVALAALVAAAVVVVPRLDRPATPVELDPVSELSVPPDAILPAGVGRAACTGKAIGYAGGRTGPNAPLSRSMENAVALAVTQHNRANPGCQVRLERVDTGGDPSTAPAAVARMIAMPDVVGVVGLPYSGESMATGAAFESAGLAHLTPSASNVALTGYGWSTVFRMLGNDATQGPAAAQLLTGRLGAEHVCVVRDDSTYGGVVASAAQTALGPAAEPSCEGTVARNQTDMAPLVSAVTGADADAVFFAGYYDEATPLVQQLRAAGFRGRFVASDGVKDSAFTSAAGAAGENTYLLCPCAPSDAVPGFAADYAAATGTQPGTYALESYDAATVLLGSIDAGIADRASVLNRMRANEQQGLSKRLTWSRTGEPESPPVFAYRVMNGRIVYVGLASGVRG